MRWENAETQDNTLLSNRGLVKTLRFRDPKYVGDPVNAIRIFNEKEVDELMVLDMGASDK
ncbi:hypothetical protein MASR1M66_22480 [Aminivibrio sp.]